MCIMVFLNALNESTRRSLTVKSKTTKHKSLNKVLKNNFNRLTFID